jgi:hypothetical protein
MSAHKPTSAKDLFDLEDQNPDGLSVGFSHRLFYFIYPKAPSVLDPPHSDLEIARRRIASILVTMLLWNFANQPLSMFSSFILDVSLSARLGDKCLADYFLIMACYIHFVLGSFKAPIIYYREPFRTRQYMGIRNGRLQKVTAHRVAAFTNRYWVNLGIEVIFMAAVYFMLPDWRTLATWLIIIGRWSYIVGEELGAAEKLWRVRAMVLICICSLVSCGLSSKCVRLYEVIICLIHTTIRPDTRTCPPLENEDRIRYNF